jgi:uncharacterized protein (DUF362 family)
VLKSFTYTAWLDACDAIIDFCKLKSHGMMGMSAAAKNLFGVIPGTMKPEYHFRFPDMRDFARMLVDINDYFAEKVKITLVDAVEGMEGNGPTKGTPRHIGVLLASASPTPPTRSAPASSDSPRTPSPLSRPPASGDCSPTR